jgi:hypothetical protein
MLSSLGGPSWWLSAWNCWLRRKPTQRHIRTRDEREKERRQTQKARDRDIEMEAGR